MISLEQDELGLFCNDYHIQAALSPVELEHGRRTDMMSEKPKGFANLSNTSDLLAKLRYNRARMSANVMDTYAAFDFFVTAEHMVDWLIPDITKRNDRARERKSFRDRNDLLLITSDIASGAKHFQALAQQHDSVDEMNNVFGGFDPNSFDPNSFSSQSFEVAGLNIKLNDGSIIHAHALADEIIKFWSHELEAKPSNGRSE